MSSSDQLAAIEPWMYRSALADSWISDAYARDTDILTKALEKSITDGGNDAVSPYFSLAKPESASSAQTFSGGGGGGGGGSGSDLEIVTPKRRNAVSGGKITKRKSRASKRNTTTFITADPANFRQMVQQVTGVKFGNGGIQMPVSSSSYSSVPLLKPEPHRATSYNRFQGCLPTLDTSAFLLDLQHNNNQQMLGTSSTAAVRDQSPAVVADGGSGFELESFASFPTLESWN